MDSLKATIFSLTRTNIRSWDIGKTFENVCVHPSLLQAKWLKCLKNVMSGPLFKFPKSWMFSRLWQILLWKKKSAIFNIYQQFQLRIYMYKVFQFGNVTKYIVSVFYLIFYVILITYNIEGIVLNDIKYLSFHTIF